MKTTNETKSRFCVGDVVSYVDQVNRLSVRGTVVRVMPSEHATRTYRIRIDTERFERSVDEADLTRLQPSNAERAFRS